MIFVNKVWQWMLPRGLRWRPGAFLGSILAACLVAFSAVAAEEHFPTLAVGTIVFTNVTITAKTTTHISFTHAGGIATIKASRLSTNMLEQLGFKIQPEPGSPAAQKSMSAKAGSSGVKLPGQLEKWWPTSLNPWLQRLQERCLDPALRYLEQVEPRLLGLGCAVLLLAYCGFCFCLKRICEKAGHGAGTLAWVPILQGIPLLQAAGMSGGLVVFYLVPILGLVVHLAWCFKICRVLEKPAWLGFLLFLPGTNVPVFVYLAGASSEKKQAESQKIQLAFGQK
jgi:hypothetical protein